VARAKSRLTETQITLEHERRSAGPLTVQSKANLVASQARFSGAKAALKQSENELQRILRLSESGLISTADLDVARTSHRTRQTELEAVQEEVNKAKAAQELTNSHHDAVRIQQQRVETAGAELQLAESELEAASIRLGSTHLYSPVRGLVARLASHPGELLEEGQTVCLIRDIDTLWVVANIEETEIRKIRRGQPVEISVDAYPGRTFTGRVLEICSVTNSQFALIPRERMGSNFVKIIQRVPVCISISDSESLLRIGLSTVVGIDIRFPEQSRVP
jgi:membrane fusion protein (multidrug efflux system)